MATKLIIQRNGQTFGPYDEAVVLQYLAQGGLMGHDMAKVAGDPLSSFEPLAKLLSRRGMRAPSAGGSPMQQVAESIRSIDLKLVFPWATIFSSAWFRDRRLVYLAAVGLGPMLLISLSSGRLSGYWAVAMYFSCLWALFFYHLFKTNEMTPKHGALCFFVTAFGSIPVLLLLQTVNPWAYLYGLAHAQSLAGRFVGMFAGVGLSEELCKAAVLFWLVRRPGVLYLPQTVVFYGMISGLGFGIYEGIGYQLTVNRSQGVDGAYFLNIARLTSLPFLHAIWTGIAGYFIAFAALYPRRRYGLWVLAIGVPALFHATYNTFGWGVVGIGSALVSVVLLSTYLASVREMQQGLARP